MTGISRKLLEHRSDAETRAVLGDLLEQQGLPIPRLGVALWLMDDVDVDVAVDVAGDVVDVDVAVDVAGDGAGANLEEFTLQNGLVIIQLPGNYYSVTLVGYLCHDRGDYWRLLPGFRVVRHINGKPRRGCHGVADDGIGEEYMLSEPAKGWETIHALRIKRCLPASHAAWDMHIERPTNFDEPEPRP